ncbi:BspA family leucine-rich repeat surface protein [Dyadobacter sp. 22481]|uniref:BspA family leucine-rich repeat surface protein n=1 Tax=Dyadobacter sp. 22481 TaxID=3453926 RepID=UPI003F87EBB7
MIQIFPKTKYALPGRLFRFVLIFLALFDNTPLRAQIAPSDFVFVCKTSDLLGFEKGIIIDAQGDYTIYYESIPAGISGSIPGVHTDYTGLQMPAPGTYRLAIRPVGATPFHRILSNSSFQDVLAIEQWGTAVWSTFERAFINYTTLSAISATDAPVLTNVTNMSAMFAGCTGLVSAPNINNWDVSHVTNMREMFYNARAFNEPLGNWDVSNVTDMFSLFFAATVFNQPLNSWDVSNVANFGGMFYYASSFDQPLDSWSVSTATDMNSMFTFASAFNQPLNGWDVSNVTTTQYMFYGAPAFNQSLDAWDMSKVTAAHYMFNGAAAFNQNLGKWALNSAVNIDHMFTGSGIDCAHYSSTLIGWGTNAATPAGLTLTATGLTYGSDASAARESLVTSKNWTISGDNFDVTCVSLPVTLVSFDASRLESSSVLTWATTEETNSDRFEIQRSGDGQGWRQIGVQASSGESTVLRTYIFEDRAPGRGLNYYRLKMVDRAVEGRDGSFAYSRIQRVDFGDTFQVRIYPNPASGRLFLDNYAAVESVVLYNVAGFKLLESKKMTAQGIDIGTAEPGLHTIKLVFADGSTKMSKVIITK